MVCEEGVCGREAGGGILSEVESVRGVFGEEVGGCGGFNWGVGGKWEEGGEGKLWVAGFGGVGGVLSFVKGCVRWLSALRWWVDSGICGIGRSVCGACDVGWVEVSDIQETVRFTNRTSWIANLGMGFEARHGLTTKGCATMAFDV